MTKIINCLICGKEIITFPSLSRKYCSRVCFGKSISNNRKGKNHPAYKGKIRRICLYCNKEFFVYECSFKTNLNLFCSKKCKGKYQTGEQNPQYKKIKINCKYCGKEFLIIPARIIKTGNFCSLKCRSQYRSKYEIRKYKRIIKYCLYCGKQFETVPAQITRKKYCSKICLYKNRYKKEIKFCIQCGNKFTVHNSEIKKGGGKFCSHRCFSNYNQKENNPNYIKDKEREYCDKWNADFRRRVRLYFKSVDRYYCHLCGKTEEMNGEQLTVHHVYYKKSVCCDGEIKRYFVLLCRSCHGKTNFNRIYWTNKFAKYVKKEFNGKCFFKREETLLFYI